MLYFRLNHAALRKMITDIIPRMRGWMGSNIIPTRDLIENYSVFLFPFVIILIQSEQG